MEIIIRWTFNIQIF